MRKIVGIILILFGIVVITFPKVEEIYYEKQKQEILNSWLESMTTIDSLNSEENPEEEISQDHHLDESSVDSLEEKEQAELRAKYIKQNTEGILKIDKIKLYQPVLKGISEKNLNISLASIEKTGALGQIGNYCIAGHRSRTYGRNFNRLDELVVGDLIEMVVGKKSYHYLVSEKLLVKAEDTWVLEGNGSDRLISLVTCDYSEKPSLRLIVRGKLLQVKDV